MDARELRIGNWVKEISTGKYRQVLMIGWDTIYTGLSNDYPNDYEPIPLTPEILEKAGFAQYERVYILTGEQLSPCGESFKLLDLEDNGHFTHKNVHIQYLHQLQNLYFALTQTELPINL